MPLPSHLKSVDLESESFQPPKLRVLGGALEMGQVSRGSAGEDQADERAGVARLSWRVSGR